jgi:hypothetical protein
LGFIAEFMRDINKVESNLNWDVCINSHWCIIDEDNNENTRSISILDFQIWLMK